MNEEAEDKAYEKGRRAAYLAQLREAVKQLGEEGNEHAWLIERAETQTVLRELCEDFGDMDWDKDLYIPDVLRNHLQLYLNADLDELHKEVALRAIEWVTNISGPPSTRTGDLGELFSALLQSVYAVEGQPETASPNWTTGIPTDGVYWWRSQALGTGGVCHIAGETVFMTTNTMPEGMPDDIEFQGPIKPPSES